MSHVTSEFDSRPVQGVRVQQDGEPGPGRVSWEWGLLGGCVGGGTLLMLE